MDWVLMAVICYLGGVHEQANDCDFVRQARELRVEQILNGALDQPLTSTPPPTPPSTTQSKTRTFTAAASKDIFTSDDVEGDATTTTSSINLPPPPPPSGAFPPPAPTYDLPPPLVDGFSDFHREVQEEARIEAQWTATAQSDQDSDEEDLDAMLEEERKAMEVKREEVLRDRIKVS